MTRSSPFSADSGVATVMGMRGLAILSACLAALALAAPAAAAKPRLSPADRKAINETLDVFVNHAVKRKDVGASYGVVTAALRGGMTRQQWSRGSIPVYPYPASGRTFHGWTVDYVTREEVGIQLLLHPRRGSKLGPFVFKVYLNPVRGEWLVDSFMPAATFAPVDAPAKVLAAADFMPRAQGDNALPTGKGRVNQLFALVPFAVLGLLLAAIAGWGLVGKIRYARLTSNAPKSLPPLRR
jgi:hypothetical protein